MSKKPKILVEELLEDKNIGALSGLSPEELRAKLHVIIYGRPMLDYESATRMIPKRKGAKYPEDAVDIHHDLDNGTAIMATKAAYHGPAFPLYKKDLESSYRSVTTQDFKQVKFEPVFYKLESMDTGRYAVFPGYADGSTYGEAASGYPFFDECQMEVMANHLGFDKIGFFDGGCRIRDEDLGHFTVRSFSSPKSSHYTLFWFAEKAGWVWSRPLSVEELGPEDFKKLSLYDEVSEHSSMDSSEFDGLDLDLRSKMELFSHFMGGYTFEKIEGSKVARFYEYGGETYQSVMDTAGDGSIALRFGEGEITFGADTEVSELVDGLQNLQLGW